MKKLTLLLSLLLTAGALTTGTAAAQASVAPYPLPSVYTASTLYSLRVNDVTVPVVSYTGYEYAGLASSGPLTIEVTGLGMTSISSYSISPRKLGVTATVSGNRLRFTVQRDEYLIVKIADDRRELVIAADPPETDRPRSSGDGIFNIRDYGTTTQAFQRALDDASVYGTVSRRGIVYVPAGVYPIGNLVLNSDTTLYLEPGAVLRTTAVKSDYTMHWHKDSINLDVTWWLRTEYGSSNIRIHGRGTIDGNGKAATGTAKFANNLLVPIATSKFSVDGITFRESGSWAVTPIRSHDLTFTNIKLFNRFDVGEDDGIDVMESQQVTVRNAIGIGLDDPFSTKTWAQNTDIARSWPGQPQRLDDVTFDDLVSWTICYGVKVGAGVIQDQSRVTFRNAVVYNAAVGIGVHQRHGAALASRILFENFDIERLSHTNAGYSTWLRLSIEDSQNLGGGTMDGVTVRNVTVRDRGKGFAVLRGFRAGNPITGVTLDGIRMPGQSTPARTLAAMNLYDRANHAPVTIRPIQDSEPPQRTNLALGRPGTASSEDGPVGYAFDGHYGTRWGSTYADPAWIQVDLGSSRRVDGAQLAWEVAYGRAYTIEVSTDGSSWSEVYRTTAGDGGMDRMDFPATTARYVRMHGTQRGTKWGYSLWEFEVYG
jgi:hypothetical protein